MKIYLLVEYDGTPYSDIPPYTISAFLSEKLANKTCNGYNRKERRKYKRRKYGPLYPEYWYSVNEVELIEEDVNA